MGRYFGIANTTLGHTVSSYWKGSPPSQQEIIDMAYQFGWSRTDQIVSGCYDTSFEIWIDENGELTYYESHPEYRDESESEKTETETEKETENLPIPEAINLGYVEKQLTDYKRFPDWMTTPEGTRVDRRTGYVFDPSFLCVCRDKFDGTFCFN